MIPIAIVLAALFIFQAPVLAQTEEELLQDLRQEVRTFGQDETGDFGSSMTLVLLGEKAYPVLVEALGDPDPAVRANAATMLSWVPEGENPVPEYVLEALRTAAFDSDERVVKAATDASDILSSPEK